MTFKRSTGYVHDLHIIYILMLYSTEQSLQKYIAVKINIVPASMSLLLTCIWRDGHVECSHVVIVTLHTPCLCTFCQPLKWSLVC